MPLKVGDGRAAVKNLRRREPCAHAAGVTSSDGQCYAFALAASSIAAITASVAVRWTMCPAPATRMEGAVHDVPVQPVGLLAGIDQPIVHPGDDDDRHL